MNNKNLRVYFALSRLFNISKGYEEARRARVRDVKTEAKVCET